MALYTKEILALPDEVLSNLDRRSLAKLTSKALFTIKRRAKRIKEYFNENEMMIKNLKWTDEVIKMKVTKKSTEELQKMIKNLRQYNEYETSRLNKVKSLNENIKNKFNEKLKEKGIELPNELNREELNKIYDRILDSLIDKDETLFSYRYEIYDIVNYKYENYEKIDTQSIYKSLNRYLDRRERTGVFGGYENYSNYRYRTKHHIKDNTFSYTRGSRRRGV